MTAEKQTGLDAGRLLAALGGLLLAVSLFLDWYGDEGSGDGITAWSSFELLDLILAALAISAILAAAEAFAPARWPRLPAALVRGAGPAALALIVLSIINKPPVLVFVPEVQLEVGIWLALAGAVLMTVGAILSRVRISFVVSPREREAAAFDEAEAERSGGAERTADPGAETRVMPRGSQPPGI